MYINPLQIKTTYLTSPDCGLKIDFRVLEDYWWIQGGARDALFPDSIFFSFSCNFRQNNSFSAQTQGLPPTPSLGNPDPPLKTATNFVHGPKNQLVTLIRLKKKKIVKR